MSMPYVDERLLPILQVREWAARNRLFAVIDACDAPAVPERAREAGPARAVSLYRGRAEDELWAVAPYLFRVDPALFDWIAAELWSTSWGIFAVADQSLEAMRLHFRRFLTVQGPQGESWYFRYYDPAVLPAFLATADAQQVVDFIGPARALAATDPVSYGIRVFTRRDGPAPADRSRPAISVRRAR